MNNHFIVAIIVVVLVCSCNDTPFFCNAIGSGEGALKPQPVFVLPVSDDPLNDPFNKIPGIMFPGMPGSPMGQNPFKAQVGVGVFPKKKGGSFIETEETVIPSVHTASHVIKKAAPALDNDLLPNTQQQQQRRRSWQ